MKKLLLDIAIILVTTIVFASCGGKNIRPKYFAGEVVCLKPDSTKATIVDNDVWANDYEIQYKVSDWHRSFCKESDIFEEKPKPQPQTTYCKRMVLYTTIDTVFTTNGKYVDSINIVCDGVHYTIPARLHRYNNQ